jgi:hypothetical protein
MKGRNFEAGHTTAPDHMPDRAKKVLVFMGASTHVRYGYGGELEWVAIRRRLNAEVPHYLA